MPISTSTDDNIISFTNLIVLSLISVAIVFGIFYFTGYNLQLPNSSECHISESFPCKITKESDNEFSLTIRNDLYAGISELNINNAVYSCFASYPEKIELDKEVTVPFRCNRSISRYEEPIYVGFSYNILDFSRKKDEQGFFVLKEDKTDISGQAFGITEKVIDNFSGREGDIFIVIILFILLLLSLYKGYSIYVEVKNRRIRNKEMNHRSNLENIRIYKGKP